MNSILTEILQTQTVKTPEGQTLPLHSQLPELEGLLLQSWLAEYQPKRLLEIGMAYGISSLYICDAIAAWPIAHYHIIDAFQTAEWQRTGFHNLLQAGYGELFMFHEVLSELCLPQFLSQELRFDFAFVDGMHRFDQMAMEFFYINRMLDVGGIVIFDDMQLPSVQKIFSYIDGYDCYERLVIPEEISRSKTFRVRKMMNVPPTRISGFVKTEVDNREERWFKNF